MATIFFCDKQILCLSMKWLFLSSYKGESPLDSYERSNSTTKKKDALKAHIHKLLVKK